jgi:hypothetical protein
MGSDDLLESGDIVDCLSMSDQKQPARSRHGARKGQQDALSSFIENNVDKEKSSGNERTKSKGMLARPRLVMDD